MDPNQKFTPTGEELDELLASDDYAPFTYTREEIANLLNSELNEHPNDYEDVMLFSSDDLRLTDKFCQEATCTLCWNTDGDQFEFNECKWVMLEDLIGATINT